MDKKILSYIRNDSCKEKEKKCPCTILKKEQFNLSCIKND